MSSRHNVSRSLVLFLALTISIGTPLVPATLEVGPGCSLANAIVAANDDVRQGACLAGNGIDTISLTDDVTLLEPLPKITSGLVLEGNHHVIGRSDSAPRFRILNLEVEGGVVLRNVTISNGRTSLDGGGVYNDATSLTLSDVRIENNRARGSGGGLMNGLNAELVSITHSTLSDNSAGANGGGLYQLFGPQVRITASTLSSNSAGVRGGAIYQSYYSYLRLVSTTLSGNTAEVSGGGLYSSFGSYQTVLLSSTIVGNSAPTAGGASFGIDNYNLTDAAVADSVFAANTGGNCVILGEGRFKNLTGNFDDDGTCQGEPIQGGIDIDLRLADNGGDTLSHAVLPGSVLIGSGGPCGLAEDQNGDARSRICGSGAVEFGAAAVGGSILGVRGVSVACGNQSSGANLFLRLEDGAQRWSCEESGLPVTPGDTIRQSVRGESVDGASGTVIGLAAEKVLCLNETTLESLEIDLGTGPSWDCLESGLVVDPGDRVRMISVGSVPQHDS